MHNTHASVSLEDTASEACLYILPTMKDHLSKSKSQVSDQDLPEFSLKVKKKWPKTK